MFVYGELLSYIQELLSEKIEKYQPLTGGDINDVFLLKTSTRQLVVKFSNAKRYPGMSEKEAKGLQELKSSDTFVVPEVWHYGEKNGFSYLLMEYITPFSLNSTFWEQFAQKLARLHQRSENYFGLDYDNYIGSLTQYNTKCNTASEFYVSCRLEPQFRLASQNGFLFSELNSFYQNVANEIPEESSSLIHGDLWSGNFITSDGGTPCLIDPAISYGSREMDIAMMHLFGGFDPQLFEVYDEIFPMEKGWKQRVPVFQLYYLLVHLNIFGSSYYDRVKKIVYRYL